MIGGFHTGSTVRNMEFPKPLASVDVLLRVDAKIPQISVVRLIEEVSNKFTQRIFIIMLTIVAVACIVFDENLGSSCYGGELHERRSCQRGAGHLDCDPIPLDCEADLELAATAVDLSRKAPRLTQECCTGKEQGNPLNKRSLNLRMGRNRGM